MNPEEIVTALDRVMPEIRQTKDPKGSLLKFAQENDLKLGQLERMGQSFNIAKTLAYMKSADSRGGSFGVLDVPDMLSDYATFEPQTKQASTHSSKGMNKSASVHAENHDPYNFHADLRLASKGIEPFDVEERGGYTVPLQSEYEKIASRMEMKLSCEMAEQFEFEQLEDARIQAEELTKSARDVNLNETITDSLGLFGDTVKSACDYVRKVAAERRVKVDVPETVEDRLYRDSTGKAGVIEKIASCIAAANASRDYVRKFAAEVAESEKTKEKGKKEEKREEFEIEKKLKNPGAASDYLFWSSTNPSDIKDPEKPTMLDAAPYKKGIIGMTALMEGADPGKPRYNARQENRDEAAEEALYTTTLQKLLIQDPVISEASDAAVVNAANSIREADPDIVRSPAELRWLLREVLQYDMEDGNIPQHVITELKKRRDMTLKNREAERKEKQQIYGS